MSSAHAQIDVGTWVRQAGPATPGNLKMTVEAYCNGGRRLTYRMSNTDLLMVTVTFAVLAPCGLAPAVA
ncbi:MAG: hypothetical protein ABI569_02210 [Casimicrobiaceae bacterium]